MHQPCYFQYVFVKYANGVGVGQHKARGIVAKHAFKRSYIHAAVFGRGNIDHLIAAHSRRGRISAVRRIRHDYLGALFIAARIMVLLDEQNTSKFAVRARCGLKGHIVHAGYLAKILPCGVKHPSAALYAVFRRKRMHRRKAVERGHFFIYARIVLHGAGSQRVKAAVHAVYAPAKPGIMAAYVRFAHFRELKLAFS